MYNLYLVKYAGVDPETGNALYWKKVDDLDENGNVIGSHEEKTDVFSEAQNTNRTPTGNIMPKAYGGFGATFKFYGFDFSFNCSYQLGGRILDYSYQDYMSGGTTAYLGQAWHKDILNSWTAENPNTNVPLIISDTSKPYQNHTSDRWLTSSNYLALNNITLGYTFPQKWISKLYLSELRIYGAAENVALWSARKGLDPRMGYVGSDASNYSAKRVISGGVRVSF